MERQQIYEREKFDGNTHDKIGYKSDDRCCHCGKLQYYGYGATIDHFIPLSKGGNNREYNLIMLCDKCNQEKGNDIVELSYIKYLKKKHLDELEGYYNSYMSSFEYLGRHNIFKCDTYDLIIPSMQYIRMSKTKHGKNIKPFGKKIKLRLAKDDDFYYICDYYAEYLKRYDMFDGYDAVEINIKFWMQWGAIYYVEDNNEIINMQVYLIRPAEGSEYFAGISHLVQMYIFSKYATDNAFMLCGLIVNKISTELGYDYKLPMFPMKVSVLKEDTLAQQIFDKLSGAKYVYRDINDMFDTVITLFATSRVIQDNGVSNKEIEQLNKFMSTFDDISKKNIKWIQNYFPGHGYYWLLYDIFTAQQIKDYQFIEPDDKVAIENNELAIKCQEEEKQDIIDRSTCKERAGWGGIGEKKQAASEGAKEMMRMSEEEREKVMKKLESELGKTADKAADEALKNIT